MDWRSLTGLLLAVAGILLGQMMEGGRAGVLLQPAGLLIVVAGTFGAGLFQSGPRQLAQAMRMAREGFAGHIDDYAGLRQAVRLWSVTARRSGTLALQPALHTTADPFIARGLRLLIDGATAHALRDILERDSASFEEAQRRNIRVWESAGGTAPTMGILGAVLGLIQVMENIANPDRLGSGIAIAFVATLYGVGMANLFFLPVAGRLRSHLAASLRRRDLLTDVLTAIAAGEALHIIEERLAAGFGEGALPRRAVQGSVHDAASNRG